jgi:hypothetical protein
MMDAIMEIAGEIQPCGVRAIAYPLFTIRKLIPSMEVKYTKKVSGLTVALREEGTMPWEWIDDSTRPEQIVPTWDDPVAYSKAVLRGYRKTKWNDQPTYVGVLSEKATIEGTIRPVLQKYEVPYYSLHGWSGATTLWDTAQANIARRQPTLLLYVGDYDPSGMYMCDVDLPRRLARYSSDDPSNKDVDMRWIYRTLAECNIEIQRIALIDGDTHVLRNTRFPASDKKKDSRYPWFVENYGHWCWELDAMNPNVLRDRLERAILAELDREAWDRAVTEEGLEDDFLADYVGKLPGAWKEAKGKRGGISGQDQK